MTVTTSGYQANLTRIIGHVGTKVSRKCILGYLAISVNTGSISRLKGQKGHPGHKDLLVLVVSGQSGLKGQKGHPGHKDLLVLVVPGLKGQKGHPGHKDLLVLVVSGQSGTKGTKGTSRTQGPGSACVPGQYRDIPDSSVCATRMSWDMDIPDTWTHVPVLPGTKSWSFRDVVSYCPPSPDYWGQSWT